MKKLLFRSPYAIFRKNAAAKTSFALILTIILSCLITAAAQGTSFFYCSHYVKVLVLTCLFLAYIGLFFYMRFSRRLNENAVVFLLVLAGVLLRCSYVLLSGLYERQHDAGAYTGIGTNFINPGHIGYVEYMYKFHKLPDINPYELFAYYHPPFHHILSYIWLQINVWLGVPENLAFENLQIPPLFYSCLCMVVTWKLLKTLEIRGNGLYIGLAFMVFHPATIVMAGSVNNDMLTILFMCLVIWQSLSWIRDKNLPGLIRLALCIGFGMITKLNSAVLAIPLGIIFLMHFISIVREKISPCSLNGLKITVFSGQLRLPSDCPGLCATLPFLAKNPGFPCRGDFPMYTAPYSLWSRLGIPAFHDWNFAFPFHPISAKACNNTWVIMFHTSMFAEEYPVDLPDVLLVLCQITFALAVILGIATVILLFITLLNRRTRKEDAIFLLSGYLIMLVSFAAFVIIYPYTCSSDFRYVTICLVYISISLGLGNKYYLSPHLLQKDEKFMQTKTVFMHCVNSVTLTVLSLITVIYIFWGRW